MSALHLMYNRSHCLICKDVRLTATTFSLREKSACTKKSNAATTLAHNARCKSYRVLQIRRVLQIEESADGARRNMAVLSTEGLSLQLKRFRL